MMRIVSLVIVSLFLCGAALADTTWVAAGSDVSGDWTDVGTPYMIEGNVRVAQMDTLHIGPGVKVYFDGPFRFTVEGTLFSLGSDGGQVVFTTDTIDHPTGWGGIRLTEPHGINRFDHTLIENGRSLGSMEYGYGGALYCVTAQVEMNSCTIRNCRAVAGQGIYCGDQSRLTLTDCLIRDNGSSTGSGGGIYESGTSVLSLTNCEIANNLSVYGGGGLIDGSTLTVNGCNIRKNDAVNNGGGLFCINGAVTITNTTFLANTAVGGGAIDGRNGMNLTMSHCLIESNQAWRIGAQGLGGGMCFASGTQQISNCTFVNNTAGTGGAVYAGSGTHLTNCIIAYQVAGGGINFPLIGADVRYSCFAGNGGGDFYGPLPPLNFGVIGHANANGDSCDGYMNLFRDPEFDPSALQAYSLRQDSPCINAGSPQSPHDPDGSIADIGAFYYALPSAAPVNLSVPSSFSLRAYPNPFNPSTSLTFTISRDAVVNLKIYDILGREAATLISARRPAGTYSVTWNAAAFPSGTYIAVLDAGGAQTTLRLQLLK